jgi:hypothetical protein
VHGPFLVIQLTWNKCSQDSGKGTDAHQSEIVYFQELAKLFSTVETNVPSHGLLPKHDIICSRRSIEVRLASS